MAETLAERMRKTPVSPSAAALWDEAINTLVAVEELCEEIFKDGSDFDAHKMYGIVRTGVRK